MKAHSGGRWLQLQAVARGALLALPFIGLQLLQGGPPQAGGREPSARPASLPGFVFVVTSTGDGDIVPPGGTVCDDGAGHCTLRAAIEAANNTSGTDDTIQFSIPTSDPGYDPATGRWTINLTRALPDLSSNIDIEGLGAGQLTVRRDTGGNYRIFNVTTAGRVSLSGLTITSGKSTDGAGVANSTGTANVTNCTLSANIADLGPGGRDGGGGIANFSGTVNVTNCTITGNSGNSGGGILSFAGTVNITNCTINNNSSTNSGGGGICNVCNVPGSTGTMNVTNCTLGGNADFGGSGGGIKNFCDVPGSTSTVNVTNCTLSGNSSNYTVYGGGGISNISYAGTSNLNVINSTISVNSTVVSPSGGISNVARSGGTGTVNVTNCTISGNLGDAGGGIYISGSTSTVNVTNCTISGNSATYYGGGIHNSGSTANIRSSLVALNMAGFDGPDVFGNFASQGYNLIGKTDGSTGFTQPTDHTGTVASPLDPKLDPSGLQDNGGPTKTIALLFGSPAIDAADDVNAPPRDQRGYVRQDAADIGAFEFGGLIPVTLANISTRAYVQTGDNVMIGGVIITGSGQKKVILRAIGPSLVNYGITNPLQDPTLELHDYTGAVIAFNDNWMDAPNRQEIIDSGLAPTNNLESAILTSLSPGNYTAIVRGVNNGTGIALVEGYDLDRTAGSKLGNISTRALVQTGDNVMIGGFIIRGPDSDRVVVRAIGPSLAQYGITNPLGDPTLELHNGNGVVVSFNDNWMDAPNRQEIIDSGLAPSNNLESAILTSLSPGNYTAIVRGVNNGTGIALVEVYGLN